MKLQFIAQQHIEEAVKFLAGKGHLPYTDASGKPNHRLMGAAWAALHGGYRGNKYEGKGKEAALAKLKAVYKSEKMDTPAESFASDGEFFQESLAQSASYSSIQQKVMSAVNANIKAGKDMDCDDDGPEDAGQCDCGCVCGQQYGCQCCGDCSCSSPKYAWCMDLFPEQVVYSMDGKLFQCDYSFDSEGDCQLGDPVAVETSYTPVTAGDCPMESFRVLATSALPLEESAYNAATKTLKVTIIKPGLNKSKARFYPAETLKRDYHVFEGAKMFADHQSEKEAKERPEGSVHNWVASLKNVHAESDGTLSGDAVVIDPPFEAKCDALNKQGLLHEMGVSIRAIGEASEQEREGVTTNVVESLIAARSVDFVTYAGAGGQIEAMESAKPDDEIDVDLVTESALRKRRPDLITLIETHAQETTMKSVETQLQEAQTQIGTLTKENTELKTKFEEAQKATQKATVAAELAKLLTESKLPAVSQERIRKQFAEAVKTDGIAQAIKEEQDYLKQVGAGAKAAPTPKNLGAADNGTTREADAGQKPNLEEAFKLMPGMSEKEAKLAAAL
jgi:hypothetical protein